VPGPRDHHIRVSIHAGSFPASLASGPLCLLARLRAALACRLPSSLLSPDGTAPLGSRGKH
jgi:hypothetical protein